MKGQLPVEGEKVEVKLEEGDWQEAVYRDANFVDLYGLPLEAAKISEWRAAATKAASDRASHIRHGALTTAAAPPN